MSAPSRIQLRRTKGWRKPEGSIVVSRPSEWGNPFAVGEYGVETRADAVALFREYVTTGSAIASDQSGSIQPWDPLGRLPEMVRIKLAGHDLVCWCPLDQPCHADVLLELANGPTT